MNSPTSDPLSRLAIPPEKKHARKGLGLLPVGLIAAVLVILFLIFWLTRQQGGLPATSMSGLPATASDPDPVPPPADERPEANPGPERLMASGYIVPRERIELTAEFPGTVESITVRKGDRMKKGDVLVRLKDAEYRARLEEAVGRMALAEANQTYAQAQYDRQLKLHGAQSGTDQSLDDARRALDIARAEVAIAQGQLALAKTYLEWCTIRAPIDGTILDRLVDAQERVIPQSFGVPRGPSTTLVAMADLNELQVEVDVNERDTAKVHLKQRCRVSPEAYPDRVYEGYVVEMAPEGNRQKGMQQVKVQIEKPDQYLTPELSAKVEFLAE